MDIHTPTIKTCVKLNLNGTAICFDKSIVGEISVYGFRLILKFK